MLLGEISGVNLSILHLRREAQYSENTGLEIKRPRF